MISSPRPISTGRLNTLRCVHLRPINVVICHGPYQVNPVGDLILERASHLDAFSAYPFRRSLTSRALAVVLAPRLRASGHRLPRLAADILGAGAARLLRLLLHPLLRLPGRSRIVAQAGGLTPRLRGLLRRSPVADVACPATSDASPALRSRALSPRGRRRSTGRWRRRSARSGRHVGIVPRPR